jgi:hypothetical protein
MSQHTCPHCQHTFTEVPVRKARTGAPAVEAPIDLSTCTDAELFAYRKRTAPAEDARFLLAHVGLSSELATRTAALLSGALPRAAHYRELAGIKAAHWRDRPLTVGSDRGYADLEAVAAAYAADALAAEDDRAFRKAWGNAMYYAKLALGEAGREAARAEVAAAAEQEQARHADDCARRRYDWQPWRACTCGAERTAEDEDDAPEPEAPELDEDEEQDAPTGEAAASYEDHYGID